MYPTQATSMVFTGAGDPFMKKQYPLPDPGAGELLVQITYTTICTSDLHTHSGRRSAPCPGVLGHEIIGRIVRCGANRQTDHNGIALQTGDLITWCVYAFDATTEIARKGMPQKSPGIYKYGHQPFTSTDGLNGGFATHCLLKNGTAVFKLPDTIDPGTVAPINCTHATIAGALRLAGDLKNKNILITGTGMLGLSACAMAKESGAGTVYALDINKERLEFSKKFGAARLFNGSLSADEINNQLSAEEKIDIVIDTTGIPDVMTKGLQLLTTGGQAIWVGAVFTQPPVAVDAEMVVRNLLTIKGLHNYTIPDLDAAVRFIIAKQHDYPFKTLVGAAFPLDRIDEAFALAKKGLHYRVGVVQ
ncbi:zinc-binding dehydrogenase [Niabella beijingensis]|uniref:zinc-binding dehydrogenase n=1 Tax=Niabella beijingensis TaxID=2872700 RepID=UPI001CBDC0E1|nr:zinc-binding dehydrogenase [Niabella beijingensis]MBZ4192388.1 zinc-binding dehydrogenase [Niabella beijingensis]